MRYLIDGYNLLHRLLRGELTEETLANAREHLGRLLLRFGSYRHPVTVYYDARLNPPSGVARSSKFGGYIDLRFVPDADEAIRARIRKEKNRSRLAVVSRDREVCGYAEKAGVRVVRVVDFVDQLLAEEDPGFDPLEPPEKYGK